LFRYDLVRHDNETAFEMLKHLAFMNGTCISHQILLELFIDKRGLEFDNALNYLLTNTYLKRKNDDDDDDDDDVDENYNNNTREYEIHEIIQNEIKKLFIDDEQSPRREVEKALILDRITYALNISLEDANNSNETIATTTEASTTILKLNPHKLQEISEHCLRLKDYNWTSSNNNSNLIELLTKMSEVNETIFYNYEHSKVLLLKLYRLFKDTSDEDALIGRILSKLGAVYSNLGKYNDAMRYYEDALTIMRKHTPHDYLAIERNLVGMAEMYTDLREYESSLRYLRGSMEICKKRLQAGDDEYHSEIGLILNKIGTVCALKHDYDEALVCFRKALEIFSNQIRDGSSLLLLQRGDWEIGNTLNHIGNVYNARREYDEAIRYYKEALEAWNNENGETMSIGLSHYHDTVTTLFNLGIVYKSMRVYDEALR
jgi:tetratricopeptide (TPR) repeat protein